LWKYEAASAESTLFLVIANQPVIFIGGTVSPLALSDSVLDLEDAHATTLHPGVVLALRTPIGAPSRAKSSTAKRPLRSRLQTGSTTPPRCPGTSSSPRQLVVTG
jgi:hypothetical protein